ncbi:hypothetical protein [Secundilactobacillus kimchicus]|uniref:hypothetical protein n=1 Tax=Secundilactobacillus kimchicus TaxID=528209 RepID=UPI0024A8157C|nr:hypothetical protein [Secundilactobacillus kimchicus]
MEYGTKSDIRVAPELSAPFTGIVDGTGLKPDANGRSIIKAGTPVVGEGWQTDGSVVLHAVGATEPDTGPMVTSIETTDTTAAITAK